MPKNGHPAIVRNGLLLLWLYHTQLDKFLIPIVKLRENMGLPRLKGEDTRFVWAAFSKENESTGRDLYEEWHNEAYQNRISFQKSSDNNKFTYFSSEVLRIQSENNLGREWVLPIIDIVLSGFFRPPDYNLHIYKNIKEKRVEIQLNSSTALADIREVWTDIKKAQMEVFGKAKKVYVTKNYKKHLDIFTKHEIEKNQASSDVVEYTKVQTTDLDVVARIFNDTNDESPTADKRRVNYLRQNKRRMNKLYRLSAK